MEMEEMKRQDCSSENITYGLETGFITVGVDCPVCMEEILDGKHAKAELVCKHKFHLSCIGSAFNSTGTMTCPLCRRHQINQPLEWSYAAGPIVSRRDTYLSDHRGADWNDILLSGCVVLAGGVIGLLLSFIVARHRPTEMWICPSGIEGDVKKALPFFGWVGGMVGAYTGWTIVGCGISLWESVWTMLW